MSDASDNHEHEVAKLINQSLHSSPWFGKAWKASRPQVSTKFADVRIDGPNGGIWVEVKMGQNDFLMNPRLGYQEREGKPLRNSSPNFPIFNGWYVAYDWNDKKNKEENSNSTRACAVLLEQVSKDKNLKMWIENFKDWLVYGGDASRRIRRKYWKDYIHKYFHMSSAGGAQRQNTQGMVNVEDMKKFVKALTLDKTQTRWRKNLKIDAGKGLSESKNFGHVYKEPKTLKGVTSYASQNLCGVKIKVADVVATHYAYKADGGAYYMQAGHDFYLMPHMNRPGSKGNDPLDLYKKLQKKNSSAPKIPEFGNGSSGELITLRLSNRSSFHEFMTEIKMDNWRKSHYSVIPFAGKINPFTGEIWTKTQSL